MQTNVNLDRISLGKLVGSIFESGNPEVYLRYPGYSESVFRFSSAYDVNAFIDEAIAAHRQPVGFAIWYPETKGYLEKRRITLYPKMTEEHTSRYSVRGWGIILLQLDLEILPLINCCVSCNSQKKAETWSRAHPELKEPDLWDWGVVERYCGRLAGLAQEFEGQLFRHSALPGRL